LLLLRTRHFANAPSTRPSFKLQRARHASLLLQRTLHCALLPRMLHSLTVAAHASLAHWHLLQQRTLHYKPLLLQRTRFAAAAAAAHTSLTAAATHPSLLLQHMLRSLAHSEWRYLLLQRTLHFCCSARFAAAAGAGASARFTAAAAHASPQPLHSPFRLQGGSAARSRAALFCPALLAGPAACRLPVLGPQNWRPMRSSRHVLIERKHSSDARGLVVLLID
jgi:hypothetical protein